VTASKSSPVAAAAAVSQARAPTASSQPAVPRPGAFSSDAADQRGDLDVTGDRDPVAGERAFQVHRLAEQRHPDLALPAVDLGATGQETPAPVQDPLLTVQRVDGGEPVALLTRGAFGVGQPHQRLRTLRDVEDPVGAGRGQLRQNGEDRRLSEGQRR
jgi:hypothetical protein